MFDVFQKYLRWIKMFLGISKFHQEQKLPPNFTRDSFLYPNDLSSKLQWHGFPDKYNIPQNKLSNGELFYFPISLAQKSLSHYEIDDFDYFLSIANWFVDNVDDKGGFDCWSKSAKNTLNNYSSMAQGQILSVLYRAYKLTNDKIYIEVSDKVYRCLMDRDNYLLSNINDKVCFDETPKREVNIILNGWIFTLWGIMDYEKLKNTPEDEQLFYKLASDLSNSLHFFDNGYWSLYSHRDVISSEFYHNLHIAQLEAMFILTDNNNFKCYSDKFRGYKNNKIFRVRALLVKAFQKVKEKKFNEFIA